MDFSPNDELSDIAILENYNIYQIDILNTTLDTLQLSWKFIEDTTPTEWGKTMCDNMNCYGLIPENGVMNPILNNNAFIKMDINPGITEGEGTLTFLIFETENQTVNHEIKFHVTTTPVGVSIVPQLDVAAYPNPTTDFLRIENGEDTDYEIVLLNILGRKIYYATLKSGENKTINTTTFPFGSYFLNFIQNQKTITSKKIHITN